MNPMMNMNYCGNMYGGPMGCPPQNLTPPWGGCPGSYLPPPPGAEEEDFMDGPSPREMRHHINKLVEAKVQEHTVGTITNTVGILLPLAVAAIKPRYALWTGGLTAIVVSAIGAKGDPFKTICNALPWVIACGILGKVAKMLKK